MDTNSIVAIVAGVLASPLATVLKRPGWEERKSFLTALLTSAGLGSVATAVSGPVTPTTLAHAMLIALATAQGVYHFVTNGTSWHDKLESLDITGRAVKAVAGAVSK